MRFFVDASILHSEPVPLEEGKAITMSIQPGGPVVQQNYSWSITFRPMHVPCPECRIEQLATTREDFHARHEQTRAWSPFNYELHARLIQGDSVVGIAFGQRVAYDRTGAVSQHRLAGDERKRVLIEELGIKEEIVQMLPLDTPTPPPPWSRTARASS